METLVQSCGERASLRSRRNRLRRLRDSHTILHPDTDAREWTARDRFGGRHLRETSPLMGAGWGGVIFPRPRGCLVRNRVICDSVSLVLPLTQCGVVHPHPSLPHRGGGLSITFPQDIDYAE